MGKADRESVTSEGVYGIDYHHGRKTKRALRYRLARRADESRRALDQFAEHRAWRILDLGTADGLMLERLLDGLELSVVVGVDLSADLLSVIGDSTIWPIQANGIHLPCADGRFDLVVATAVLEHVSDPLGMLAECRRVLVPGGLCLITTPDPFWERVASAIGHLPAEGHHETLNLKRLRSTLEQAGFEVLRAYKFMMSPWGFPAELVVERLMRAVGLSSMLLNQMAVARRPELGQGAGL